MCRWEYMPCAAHAVAAPTGWCQDCVAEDLASKRAADPDFQRVRKASRRAVKLPLVAKLLITAIALVPSAVAIYAMDSFSDSPIGAVPMILLGGSAGLAFFWIWSMWRHR